MRPAKIIVDGELLDMLLDMSKHIPSGGSEQQNQKKIYIDQMDVEAVKINVKVQKLPTRISGILSTLDKFGGLLTMFLTVNDINLRLKGLKQQHRLTQIHSFSQFIEHHYSNELKNNMKNLFSTPKLALRVVSILTLIGHKFLAKKTYEDRRSRPPRVFHENQLRPYSFEEAIGLYTLSTLKDRTLMSEGIKGHLMIGENKVVVVTRTKILFIKLCATVPEDTILVADIVQWERDMGCFKIFYWGDGLRVLQKGIIMEEWQIAQISHWLESLVPKH